MENMISIERKVKEIIDQYFPGYSFSLMGDPEDDSVQLIRLYDVDDDDVKSFRSKLWDVIEGHLEIDGVTFIPSIVSHANTEKFYADRLRIKNYVFIDEATLSLHDELLKQLESMLKNFDYTIGVNCDSIKADLPCTETRKYKIPVVKRFEDGGCGYAGEKCRLAA